MLRSFILPNFVSNGEQRWSPRKIPYKTLPFEVIDSTIDENSHDEEDEEDEQNIQEYEIHGTNINEAPNEEEEATELKNSNETPNIDEDSTIENSKITQDNLPIEAQDHPVTIDEIRNFVEACWILAPEAAWRILGFKINGIHPAVTHLQLHLQDQQRVNFAESSNLSEIATAKRNRRTILTEYFQKNAENPEARNLLYANFLMHYTWNKQRRIYMAHPNKVKGARSYNDLKEVNGITCETFKESALLRGFLENNDSYRQSMSENFAHISIPNGQHLIQATLQHLNALLQRHSKTISNYDLPELLAEIINSKFSLLLLEELSYNINEIDLAKINSLNEEQQAVFNEIIHFINQEAKTFAEYLLRIGNGTEPVINNNLIRLPNEIVVTSQNNNNDPIDTLSNVVYSNLAENATNTLFITERAILTPLNSDVDDLNNQIMAKFSGEQ
ncbi:9139_t:CDS:2 [Gigaspora margarita]|uniref:9139_t:CDS:1 n=1 Tax=Gigaspora margarita TaxID=4874 RepID=A0ABN7UHM0_GIGMA|nr:9139_t:CDS:2 [Gigaspora margarita]